MLKSPITQPATSRPFSTAPEIAKRYGVSTRQVNHALERFGIESTVRIAGARLFDADGEARIVSALRRTGALAPVGSIVRVKRGGGA